MLDRAKDHSDKMGKTQMSFIQGDCIKVFQLLHILRVEPDTNFQIQFP